MVDHKIFISNVHITCNVWKFFCKPLCLLEESKEAGKSSKLLSGAKFSFPSFSVKKLGEKSSLQAEVF